MKTEIKHLFTMFLIDVLVHISVLYDVAIYIALTNLMLIIGINMGLILSSLYIHNESSLQRKRYKQSKHLISFTI